MFTRICIIIIIIINLSIENTVNQWFCVNPRYARINPFKPEFTIVIFIHYKPRIAVAILDLQWMKMIWFGLKIKENVHVLVNQFHGNIHSKTLSCGEIKSVFRDV